VTRIRPWLRDTGALLLALGALACATPPSEQEIDAELRQIAGRVKPRGELRCVPLVADSRMDAFAKLAESTAEGAGAQPSQQARRLVRAFAQADRRYVAVVTGGPYASLNERVVQDAFDARKAPRLAGLTLVYVSPEPPSPELRAVVKSASASLVHAAPPER
jgi:hypothetical protein